MNTEKPCDGQIVETKDDEKNLKGNGGGGGGMGCVCVSYVVYKYKNEHQLLIRNTTSQKTFGKIFLNY